MDKKIQTWMTLVRILSFPTFTEPSAFSQGHRVPLVMQQGGHMLLDRCVVQGDVGVFT